MKNVDRIKHLENELGRYRKKVADQAKEEERLRSLLETAQAGSVQMNRVVDAILVQAALTYGEVATDEETGAFLGCRLSLPLFLVDDVLGEYEVRARRDETEQKYIVGVVPRQKE